ncbi:MAG: HEPN domain-containing protein [Prosthecobacter sp.]|nr:HEPN domain-containing protein [Prosthecobacter sp.]
MKAATRDWIDKAEGDFQAAGALARRRKAPLHNHVCFNSQQCAEKYLKARLEEAGIHYPKTHDLEKLLLLVLPVEPMWTALRPAFKSLSGFAVEFRYPGAEATAGDAAQALKDVKAIRKEARFALGL